MINIKTKLDGQLHMGWIRHLISLGTRLTPYELSESLYTDSCMPDLTIELAIIDTALKSLELTYCL